MIDRQRVMMKFLHLCGINDDNSHDYDEIVDNACSYTEKHTVGPILAADLERLEFAAAAVAVYDNTLLRLINDKTLCTADGRQMLGYKDSDAYKYAVKLREHAVSCVSDIWADNCFCFTAAEG